MKHDVFGCGNNKINHLERVADGRKMMEYHKRLWSNDGEQHVEERDGVWSEALAACTCIVFITRRATYYARLLHFICFGSQKPSQSVLAQTDGTRIHATCSCFTVFLNSQREPVSTMISSGAHVRA